VQQTEAAQLDYSDSCTILRRKSTLDSNSRGTEAEAMVFASLLITPLVMAAAAHTERQLGPSAAGWVAALPVSFAIAVVAVAVDAGDGSARTMALSAAAHVPAQVVFAVVFAALLTRRGLLLGGAAGALAYLACSVVLAGVPALLAVVAAVPALALAPRLITSSRPRVSASRQRATAVMTCVAGPLVVGTALLTIRYAGPVAAGAAAAFPTISTTLAVAVVMRDGRPAGAHALVGLVRSLPCYLTFCLVVVLAAPSVGLPAVALAVLACLAAARLTWRSVPLASAQCAVRIHAPTRGDQHAPGPRERSWR
jgi:hypothetical protein